MMRPLLSWSRFQRRLVICRLLACTITGTLIWMLLLSPTVTSQPTAAAPPRNGHAAAHPKARSSVEENEVPLAGAQIRLQEQTPEDASVTHGPHSSPFATTNGLASNQDSSDSAFENAILSLSTFIQDESKVNSLLSPMPAAGGTALLRDLAFRSRAFREAFATWESLHFIHGPNGRIELQNVVQRLRHIAPAHLRDAINTYDRFRVFLNRFAFKLFPWTRPYFTDHMMFHASFYDSGRGIVFTAGTDQAQYLLTSIPALRRLGCDLPIEIIYLGDDDLSEDSREALEALPGVMTKDISSMVDDRGWTLKGWAAKPFAILYSSFREVIFVDADALFLTNPEALFDDPQYRKTGALFFKDRSVMPENRRKWLRDVLPKPISHHVKQNRFWTGESGHMQDSGVVMIDKWRHFVPLLLTTRLNGPDRDGNSAAGKKGVYEMVYGDKETFWLSWELAGDLDYAFHDGATGNMGVLFKPGDKEYEFDGDDEEEEEGDAEGDDEEEEGEIGATDDSKPNDELTQHSTPSVKETTDNYTICSPQLLHYDRQGKPLWINGWLATSKSEKSKFRPFEVYMREPASKWTKETKNPWELKRDNVVCLTNKEYFEFSSEEQKTLKGLLESAQRLSVERAE